MKSRITLALLVLSLILAAQAAGPPPGTIKHVVMIIQENRTPDNLFGGNPTFELGVNITQPPSGKFTLAACFDPKHTHNAWEKQWPGDGSYHPCDSRVVTSACNPPITGTCLQQTYVDPADIDPYFQIGRNWGFANFMFQTNEGPSFPAHHFLFSGTSVPYTTGNLGDFRTNQWFVSGNTDDTRDATCAANALEEAHDVSPDDHESYAFNPPFITWGQPGYPCYDHQTLADVVGNGGKSWRYYAWKKPGSIWNAPYSIFHLCQPTGAGGSCQGSHFQGVNPDVTTKPGQILLDVNPNSSNPCDLKSVSWVVPDGFWSDHPGGSSTKLGPVWVSRIINAIGNTTCTDNGVPYWQDTVILVTWDDWGGWYDHIRPYIVVRDPNFWGSGFVSSFRVPLLFVSAYTDPGTVSGAGIQTPDCLNLATYYCHDFGSILAFTENIFGLGPIGLADGLHYADEFAPDNKNGNVPLSEFLTRSTPRSFTPINLPPDAPPESYFTTYTGMVDPDDED